MRASLPGCLDAALALAWAGASPAQDVRLMLRLAVPHQVRPLQQPVCFAEGASTQVSAHPDGRRVGVRHADGTVAFYAAGGEQLQKLCTLADLNGGQWVVFDTDGRFDADRPEDLEGPYLVRDGKPETLKEGVGVRRRVPGLLARTLGAMK